jgi:hypothetical protein
MKKDSQNLKPINIDGAVRVTLTNKAQETPDDAKTYNAIKVPVQIYRITTDLNKYRIAVQAAENLWNPDRYLLYQLYQQSLLDSHVTACIQQRTNLLTGLDYCVYNNDGTKNDDKTKLVRTKWFREFIDYALQSKYWGHSLVQFEDVVTRNGIDEFREVELVPRQFVKPEFGMVVASTASLPPDGIYYGDQPYSNWCISIGKIRDLGLLLKITPLVIWKKNALGSWAEYIEKFGSPIRVGKTDSTDLEAVNNMQNMLQNMGVAAWGLFKTDDQIEFVQANSSDAYNVFNEMINRCNEEISKLILGQTMTTDNGSSLSQAEVHERVLMSFKQSDKQFVYSVLNDQLIPLMNNLGFGLEGCYINVEKEEEFSMFEKADLDIKLINTGKYILSPEYLNKKYGTEVFMVEQPEVEEGNEQEMENETENELEKIKDIFNKQEMYSDYPQQATKNAQKMLKWKKEHADIKGGTSVGWTRCRQLANRESISRDIVSRMAQFNRHRKNATVDPKYKDTPWKDAGYVAWNIWGGTEGVDWAIRKMEQIKKQEAENDFEEFMTYKNKLSKYY